MKRREDKNKVGRPKLADNKLKRKSYIMLGVALFMMISLISVGLSTLSGMNLIKLKGSSKDDVYDVILFWGQSNMVGYAGKYETSGSKTGEDKYDSRVKKLGKEKFSKYSRINKNIVEKYSSVDHVNVDIANNTAFEYKYSGNKLESINKNTESLGETLKYNSTSKKIENGYDSMKSYGTNMIPQFAKTYYEKTGHKVVAVMVAHGGYEIQKFQSNQPLYKVMKIKYNSAINYLNKKNYKIGEKYYVVFQGEANVKNTSTNDYYKLFMNVHNNLKNDLKITHGFIVETSTTDGTELMDKVKNINYAHKKLISDNYDISLASDYPYKNYTPSEKQFSSSETVKSGNQYKTALGLSKLSKCITPAAKNKSGQDKNAIHFNSAALSQIGYETAVNASKVTKNNKKCSISVSYKTNVAYKVSCPSNYSVTKLYYVYSNEATPLKSLQGTIKTGINLVGRKMVIYAKLKNKSTGQESVVKSDVITINKTSNAKHVLKQTYCKVYTYNTKGTSSNYSIRCDRHAMPQKISLVIDGKERLVDTKWKSNYGYWANDLYIDGLVNNKKYNLKIAYYFIDKQSSTNQKIVMKYDSYKTSFVAGKNINQLEKFVDKTSKEEDKKCSIELTKSESKSLNYKFKCGKNAKPGSIDITTNYPDIGKNGSKVYLDTIKLGYKSVYLNGEKYEVKNIKNTGAIRGNFASEASKKNSDSWGMSEIGKITGLETNMPYTLYLYYSYRKDGKNIGYVKAISNEMFAK